jgi:hypothetical protein
MNKFCFFLLIVSICISCTKKVVVGIANPSPSNLVNQPIEICLCQLKEFDPSSIVVIDPSGKEIPSQILTKGTGQAQSLVFLANIGAGQEIHYTLKKGKPSNYTLKAQVFPIGTNMEGIAWENDQIALYFPNGQTTCSGIQIKTILKPDSTMFLEEWLNEIQGLSQPQKKIIYAFDSNKSVNLGLICPKVKGVYLNGFHFDQIQILDAGPVCTSFILSGSITPYIGGIYLHAEYTFRLYAGSCMNQISVRYAGENKTMELATFIPESKQKEILHGVILTGSMKQVYSNYKIGEEVVYYSGVGGKENGFKTNEDWDIFLANTKHTLENAPIVKLINM